MSYQKRENKFQEKISILWRQVESYSDKLRYGRTPFKVIQVEMDY